MSGRAPWAGNFRDLAAAVTGMATLADSAGIDAPMVDAAIARPRHLWRHQQSSKVCVAAL